MLQVDIEKIMPVTEARDKFNQLIDDVEDSDNLYVLTKNGKPCAVMVGVNHLEKLTGENQTDVVAKMGEVKTEDSGDEKAEPFEMPANDTVANEPATPAPSEPMTPQTDEPAIPPADEPITATPNEPVVPHTEPTKPAETAPIAPQTDPFASVDEPANITTETNPESIAPETPATPASTGTAASEPASTDQNTNQNPPIQPQI